MDRDSLNHQFRASVAHGGLYQFCFYVIHSLRIIPVPEMRCRTMRTPKMTCEWRSLPRAFHFGEGARSDGHHVGVPPHANRAHTCGESNTKGQFELIQDSGRCRRVVLRIEVGGRWSNETATFLRPLAHTEAHQAPAILLHSLTTSRNFKNICITWMFYDDGC